MSTDIFEAIDSLPATENLLRPLMNQAKTLTSLTAAVAVRHSEGLPVKPMAVLLDQIETVITDILQHIGLATPGEEWQRGLVRTPVVNQAARDVERFGEVRSSYWTGAFVASLKALHFSKHNAYQLSSSAQVHMALADCSTRLLCQCQHFALLHTPDHLATTLVHRIYEDASALSAKLAAPGSRDHASLLCNMIKNHTHLMCTVLKIEQARIEPTLTPEIITAHPRGLPLDNMLAQYQQATACLTALMPDAAAPTQTSAPEPRVPSFMR